MIEDVRPEGCICEPCSDIRCYPKLANNIGYKNMNTVCQLCAPTGR
jgi:hypothetical protein